MSYARLRSSGAWIIGSTIEGDELEAMDAIRPDLPNGSEGSTHNPAAPIILGGAGLAVGGPFTAAELESSTFAADGLLDVGAGAKLTVEGGGTWTASGAMSARSGSVFAWQNGSTLSKNATSTWTLRGLTTLTGASGVMSFATGAKLEAGGAGVVEVAAGGEATVTGTLTFSGSANHPGLSQRSVQRSRWRLAATDYSVSFGPTGAYAWEAFGDGGGGSSVRTAAMVSSGPAKFLIEFTNLPHGGRLTSVVLKSRGLTGSANLVKPVYRVVRWRNASTRLNVSNEITDEHSVAGWTSVAETTIDNLNHVLVTGYHYGILVYAPYETSGSGASMSLLSATAILTVSEVQP